MDGVPQTESRLDLKLAALLASFSFLTSWKNCSSLFIRNFSIQRSLIEFSAERVWSF